MKHCMTLILIVLFIAAVAVPVQGQAWKGKGRLTGTITDQEGKPLEGAVITFQSDKLVTSLDVTTDKDGKFTVSGIKGGSWNVDVKKEGYKTELITLQLKELSYNKPLEMKLQKLTAGATTAAPAKDVPGMSFVIEARQLQEANDNAGAIAKYEAAIQANPEFYWAHGEIGIIFEKMGQFDQAIASYQKFLEKEPGDATAQIRIANILFEQEKTEEARKMLESIATLEGIDNAPILYNMGARLYNANQIKLAITYLKKAVEVDPSMSDAYLQLGFALSSPEINDVAAAKQAFQKVIELDPSSENAKAAKEFLDLMK